MTVTQFQLQLQDLNNKIEELKTKLNYYEKIENQTLTDFHEVTGEKDENSSLNL